MTRALIYVDDGDDDDYDKEESLVIPTSTLPRSGTPL
jgi:hypothetical protein